MPALIVVPSIPCSISLTNSAVSSSAVRAAIEREGSSQWPVQAMMFTPLRSATSRINRMSRPRSMVVTSTKVRRPPALASARMPATRSMWASRPPNSSGQACQKPAEAAATCSCISVNPRSALSSGPRLR